MAKKTVKKAVKAEGKVGVREYKLKPDWTNVFQQVYDMIDDYEATPEVKAKLKELWEMLKTALLKYGEDALVEIINMLLKDARTNLTNYVL